MQCEYLAQGFYKNGVKGVVLPAAWPRRVHQHGRVLRRQARSHHLRRHRLLSGADPPLWYPRVRAGRLLHGV
ncbi:MAG: hypothetical protein ACLRNQ_10270 [Flavonifractor plautii]